MGVSFGNVDHSRAGQSESVGINSQPVQLTEKGDNL
jgi:hypothetical protein